MSSSSIILMICIFSIRRRPSNEKMFTIGVMVDIKSEQAISIRDLGGIIEAALEKHKIGDVTVKRDEFYELVTIKGDFII